MVPYFMIKTFLILINFQIFLYASQQIILVVSKDFNTSYAFLERFEGSNHIGKTLKVNIGKNGLGWGLGEIKLNQKKSEPIKKEGDKKAPAGVFKLSYIFGYEKNNFFNMSYLHSSKNLICVDDTHSSKYNQIINIPNVKPKSFEYMKRDDKQYELGIVVAHNTDGIKQRGSCIFIHVQKHKNTSTAGCTSMTFKEIRKITSWLDKSKNPILIQIPASSSKEILKLFPELKGSKLLN